MKGISIWHLGDIKMDFYSQKKYLIDFNVNPIIEMNLSNHNLYLNSAARSRFPDLLNTKFNNPLLNNVIDQFTDIMSKNNEMVVFFREFCFAEQIFEQHIFGVPQRNSIIIFMIDITKHKPVHTENRKLDRLLKQHLDLHTVELKNTIKKLQYSYSVLHKTKNELSQAMHNAEVGTWNWDVYRDFFIINEQMQSLFGIEDSLVCTTADILNLIHPDDKSQLAQQLTTAWKKNEKFNVRFRTIAGDGTIKNLLMKGSVYSSESLKNKGMSGVCLEII